MALLTGGANAIRYVLFAFNLAFVITGIILISVGASVESTFDEYNTFLADKFFSIPTFLIVIGVFIFLIAFFGCCGAYQENYRMIFIFGILLTIIFIFELSAGIAGYVLRGEAKDLIQTKLHDSMSNYNKDHTRTQYLWDTLHTTFNCCGTDSAKDWAKYYNQTEPNPLPLSCCTIPIGVVGTYTCDMKTNNKDLHAEGCLSKFVAFISSHAVSLGATGIIFAIIQLLGIIFAFYIAKQVKIKNGVSGVF